MNMTCDKEIMDNIYIENEINANKGLAKGCFFSAVAMLVVWIFYITGLFQVHGTTFKLVNIVFPILIVVLGINVFFTNTKVIEKHAFKYFLIVEFVLVIFTLNVLLPKHAILMWAACIVLVNHYFSPRTLLITYILVSIFMFFGLYFGMFLGEWDPNTLNGARYIEVEGRVVDVDVANVRDRILWIRYLKDLGDNRYLKVFLYYYLPRWIILTTISNMAFAISKRTKKLLMDESNQAQEKQKLQSELNVATSIQYSVLPKQLEDENKDNIYGIMTPAKEVGGDFYDYFYIDDNHIAFVIADVSGKGIPAALFMMKTEALVKSLALSFKEDTAMIMSRANVSLCYNNEVNLFVTCWLGILNLETGELKYTNAGHNKAIIMRDGVPEYLKDKPGVALGVFEDVKYKENTINLNKGDRILLYTDGVTEAHNDQEKLYGEDRLLKFAEINRSSINKEFVLNLMDDIHKFSNGAEQFDDITILLFDYNIVEKAVVESRIFKADVKELDNLFDYSSKLLEMLEFSNKEIIMINTALEEVFVNVAHYAYEGKGEVEITLSKKRNSVTFIFKDSGKEFNPLEREDPNITADSEEREVGGLGIFMVKKIMDEVRYEYSNHQNILTLIKYKK